MQLKTKCVFHPSAQRAENVPCYEVTVKFENLEEVANSTKSEMMKEMILNLPKYLKNMLYLQIGCYNFAYSEVEVIDD